MADPQVSESDDPGAPHVGLFRALSNRLSRRTDSEHEQAIVRMVIGLLVYAYMFSYPYTSWFKTSAALSIVRISAAIFITFSITLFISVIIWPGRSPSRRILGMVVDLGTLSFLISQSASETAVPLLGIYLWSAGQPYTWGGRPT